MNYFTSKPRRVKFDCGCSVMVAVDGEGGLDASFLKLCDEHGE